VSDDLREEREFLLRSIRDLDDEHAAGDLDEDDYRTLRDEYTARAADVLRRLESADATATADDEPLPVTDRPSGAGSGRKADEGGDRRRRGRARIAAGVLLLAAVSGGAGYAVASSSGERLAGDEASGDITQGPTDRITKAQVLVSEGKILEAVKVYDDLLADDPENPVALAQRGWLLSRVDDSLVDSGLASIDRAIAIEPTYPDAYFFKGTILLRAKGDPQLASATYQQGIDAKPPPQLLSILQQLKAEADAQAAAGASTTSTP
jgi:tetratricopeptide (TPR) repeat protein